MNLETRLSSTKVDGNKLGVARIAVNAQPRQNVVVSGTEQWDRGNAKLEVVNTGGQRAAKANEEEPGKKRATVLTKVDYLDKLI